MLYWDTSPSFVSVGDVFDASVSVSRSRFVKDDMTLNPTEKKNMI